MAAVNGASYTYAYNDSNELTTMNLDGVETHFTYDDWGRTASKFVGDGSVLHAEYGYRYGDKLKQVFSTFPGEPDEVHFIHDGLGKRRSSVIARKESSTDEAIWAMEDGFEPGREYVSKCRAFPQIASSLEDSLFAMTSTADANPAMEVA